jgi:hypothetical protein
MGNGDTIGLDPPFLISALDRDDWLTSRPGRFTPEERAPGIHCVGDKVVPEPVLTLWIREKSCPYRESNTGHAARRYTN